MSIVTMLFVAVFTGLALDLGWTAYKIQFRDRTDLIRLGKTALPHAAPLKSRFAALYAAQAVAYAVTAVIALVTGSLSPAATCLMFAIAAMMIWQSVLIRALKHYAESQRPPQ
jgi:hypothetical protein